MICGARHPAALQAVDGPALLATPFTLRRDGATIKLGAVAGAAPFTGRALIFDADGALAVASQAIAVPAGAPRRVIEWPLDSVEVAAGKLWLAVAVDGDCELAVGDGGGGVTTVAGVAAGDEPPAELPAGDTVQARELEAFLTLDAEPPSYAGDAMLAARYGPVSADRALRTVPEARSTRTATCGWHGELFDPERGNFAVVREDGPLADLLNERIVVRQRFDPSRRDVVAYVHRAADVLEDLSLTRRAFMALAGAWHDELQIEVEVML